MMLLPQLQVCHNLMGSAAGNPVILTGEAMDEEVTLNHLQGKHPVALTWILLSKHYLAAYFNEKEQAISIALSLSRMKIGAILPFALHNHIFLDGLMAATASRTEPSQLKRATRAIAKLKSIKRRCGDYYANKIYLMEAELAASRRDRDCALILYQHSIEESCRQGLIHEQALACEKAGYALYLWSDFPKSRDYLNTASSLYGQWGGQAKVKQIDSFLEGLVHDI